MQPTTHAGGPPLGGVVGTDDAVVIVAANSLRGYFIIFNTHATGTIYLSLSRGLDEPEVGKGIIIAPGGYYEITASNMYRDVIEAIADEADVSWCGVQGGAG